MKDTLQTAALKLRIDQLQEQVKALKDSQALNQIKYRAVEHQEVVNRVNDFYDSAWIKLLLYFAPLVILVPIIIQWMQQRNFKNTSDAILNQLSETFDSKIELLKNTNANEIENLNTAFMNKAIELEDIINKRYIVQSGLSYVIKGITDAESDRLDQGVYYILYALNLFLSIEDAVEIKNGLRNLNSVLLLINNRHTLEVADDLLITNDEDNSIDKILEKLNKISDKEYFQAELNLAYNRIDKIRKLK